MAQELEKVNMSPKQKNEFFLHKIFFLNFSFWRNPVFSKNLVPYQKPTPYTCTTSSYATNPNNILLLLQALGPHEAAIPEKETKILKEGRAATGAHLTKMKAQYQTFQTRYSSFLWYA